MLLDCWGAIFWFRMYRPLILGRKKFLFWSKIEIDKAQRINFSIPRIFNQKSGGCNKLDYFSKKVIYLPDIFGNKQIFKLLNILNNAE